MTMLVTLDEAKLHLRVDHDDDDDDITLKIEAASAAVLGYIGDAQYDFLDTGGDPLDLDELTEQPAIRALHIARQAALLLLGEFYRNREPAATDVMHERFGYGYLPRAVVALLWPYRTPTLG